MEETSLEIWVLIMVTIQCGKAEKADRPEIEYLLFTSCVIIYVFKDSVSSPAKWEQ